MLQLILFCVCAGLIINWLCAKPDKFPPGPTRWPIVGNLLEMSVFTKGEGKHEALSSLANKYGDIMGLHLGVQPTVVVSGHKLIKELCAMDILSGRLRRPINGKGELAFSEDRRFGLIFNDGDDWKEQRRFSLRHMKDLGFGKMSMETIIHEEVEILLKEVCNNAGADFGRPVELYEVLGVASVNVLWFIIASERYSHSDARVRPLTKLVKIMSGSLDSAGSSCGHFPWLVKWLPGAAFKFQQFLETRKKLCNFIQERIDEHKKTIDTSSPRDFIDLYLREIMDKDKAEGSSFSEAQLLETIFEMFIAGFDTSYNSMASALVSMVVNPDVQAKVQAEIDAVVGRNRLPSLADRSSLPYVEATIEEVFRSSTVLPLSVPHAVLNANKNVPFHGYIIPAEARILINLYHIHNDEKLWKDPENFRPERFITEDNKVRRPEYLIPFGSGKRQCLGETLARNNTFLFFASIMQKFELSVPEGRPPPNPKDFEGAFSIGPKPYEAKFTPRF